MLHAHYSQGWPHVHCWGPLQKEEEVRETARGPEVRGAERSHWMSNWQPADNSYFGFHYLAVTLCPATVTLEGSAYSTADWTHTGTLKLCNQIHLSIHLSVHLSVYNSLSHIYQSKMIFIHLSILLSASLQRQSLIVKKMFFTTSWCDSFRNICTYYLGRDNILFVYFMTLRSGGNPRGNRQSINQRFHLKHFGSVYCLSYWPLAWV